MNINNHRNVASRSKWKENNLLYGKLKKEENWKELIEEVFIIPSKQEYPHHVIRGNTLVLSVDGVKRVYNQLKEKGLYHGKAKQHIDRHLKELGIKMNTSRKMEENFAYIENALSNHSTNYVIESSEDEESVVPKKEDKNGVKRKNLYIAFIEYCKKLNPKNTFSSLFDKDIFKERYSFIPHEMRYFYRLANPMSCIIPVIQFESVSFFEDTGIQQALDQIKKNNKSESEDSEDVDNDLTEENDVEETIEDDSIENEMMIFFSINDLPKINEKNDTNEYVIFAGSPKEYYVFRNKDKKIYKSNDDKITEPIADSFDLFIQKIVGKEYL